MSDNWVVQNLENALAAWNDKLSEVRILRKPAPTLRGSGPTGLPSDGHWYVGTNLTEVTQASALPGDIALYDDASHVGIVVGRNSAGRLLICHCSSGQNNVVVTEFAAAGFTALGRPGIYTA